MPLRSCRTRSPRYRCPMPSEHPGPDPTQLITFGPEAGGFAEVLWSLCHETPRP